ncbi:MAG: glycosyltransferase [Caulobacteraceae bacterium]
MISLALRDRLPNSLRRIARGARRKARSAFSARWRGQAAIESLYLLFLGRPARAEDIEANRDKLVRDLATTLLVSAECEFRVLNPIRSRRNLGGDAFDVPPPADVLAWASATLAPKSAAGIRAARDWYALYEALFSDGDVQVLAPQLHLGGRDVLGALNDLRRTQGLHEITGLVEESDGDQIRGWVVDLKAMDRPLRAELWVEGAFAAAAPADLFRREIQDLYGGTGVAGFAIPAPSPAGRPRSAEVREATTGARLGGFVLASRTLPLSELGRLRQELSEVRAALQRVEHALPQIEATFSFPVSAYDAYVEAYEGSADTAPTLSSGWSSSVTVVVDALDAQPGEVEAFLGSLAAQGDGAWDAILICPRGLAAIVNRDLAARVQSASGHSVRVRTAPAVQPPLAFHRVLQQASGELVVFAPASAQLAAGALNRVVSAATEPDAHVIFGDDDRLEVLSPRLSRRSDPCVRSAFDHDLTHQQVGLGSLLAFRKSAALAAGGLRGAPCGVHLHDLVLRIVEQEGEPAVRHTPHVLLHRLTPVAPPVIEALRAAVAAHLGRTEPQAKVEARTDILGAAPPSTLRVRRPHLLENRRAAVIIPTRDRLDLLQPCIDSLLERLPRNRVSQEIVVVDNRSEEPATLTYLEQLRAAGHVRVERFDGPFNWALINNAAARGTDADVLVFLNNDTVALSPDWCDALCEQALRPQVAAVGARLLYGDGTIQHGGVVVGVRGFALHEAVGCSGGDPGYLGRQALVRRVSAVTGACLATRTDVFRRLGGFDGVTFPVDGNDIDYCLRAIELDLRVVYTPDSTLYHLESKSRGYDNDEEKRLRAQRASEAMWRRWGGPDRLDPHYSPRFARDARPFARLRPWP